MSSWDKLRAASKTNNRMLPSGIELMERINDGMLQRVPSEYLEEVRSKVTENCEELIETGARIRPLIVDKKQIGWVRGIHMSERKVLQRWLYDPNEFILHTLVLATTLKREEIESLTGLEIRNIVELVRTMSSHDFSLYPYLSAFVTTSVSESLWHSRGTKLSSYENRKIELPDGNTMRILAPPDHARLWATLCTLREQSKKRLDDNWNALLIIRPWAGKSADPISSQLKGVSRSLQTDTVEAWDKILKVETKVDTSDGWAHPADDEQGLLRELKGMLSHDKHEQVMEEVERRLISEAEANRRKLDEIIQRRGGIGINEETVVVETDEQVRLRELALRKGMVPPPPTPRDTETALTPVQKIKRYQ